MKAKMAPQILAIKDLTPSSHNYKFQAIVAEKGLPRLMGKTPYQRLILQDKEGDRIQAMIFNKNIGILENTLKLYSTYTITNAPISTIQERYRFLDNPFQVTMTGKTPIQQTQIDGLTVRSMKYNFTPLSEIENITAPESNLDVLFAILNVGPQKKIKGYSVADLKIIDQALKPMTVSHWDQFSEVEATAMTNLAGTFHVAIGMRLKRADYYGVGLATRNSTIFIFNPPIPEATGLQQWCLAHADAIKESSLTSPGKIPMLKYKEPTADEIIKIINLPSKVEKPEYPSIEGLIKVTNFNQKFLFLACTKCNRSTDASDEEEFYCNHCQEQVKALPKIMFQVQITDATDSITATIFAPPAEDLFQITAAEMVEGTLDGHVSMPLLQKLSATYTCSFHLKAYMYDYGGIEECRFNIQALFLKPTTENEAGKNKLLLMAPKTPIKKAKTDSYEAEQSTKPSTGKNHSSSDEMDDQSEDEKLQRNKKND